MTTTTHARCDDTACGAYRPVAELVTLGRLRYCRGCAEREERIRAVEAATRRAEIVLEVLGAREEIRVRNSKPCGPECLCCERGVPAGGELEENGQLYMHTGSRRAAVR